MSILVRSTPLFSLRSEFLHRLLQEFTDCDLSNIFKDKPDDNIVAVCSRLRNVAPTSKDLLVKLRQPVPITQKNFWGPRF